MEHWGGGTQNKKYVLSPFFYSEFGGLVLMRKGVADIVNSNILPLGNIDLKI